MARPPSSQPTEGELEILKVLWEQGPSGLKQVCDGMRKGRPVATTTVATMLKLMQEKGLVDRGEGESARGSVYLAAVSREAASTSLVRRLMDLVFDGSARGLVAHMLETEKLSERDRDEIRRLLDEDDARKAPRYLDRGRKGAGHEWGRHESAMAGHRLDDAALPLGRRPDRGRGRDRLEGTSGGFGGGALRSGPGEPGDAGPGPRGDRLAGWDSSAGPIGRCWREPVAQAGARAIPPSFVRQVEGGHLHRSSGRKTDGGR